MVNFSYQVSFTSSLEPKLLVYLKSHSDKEIFLGLIGKIVGKKNTVIAFSVTDCLPFPNKSTKTDKEAIVTEGWLEIVREYVNFHCSSTSIRALGVLHSHPDSIPVLSSLDQDFGIRLAQDLGNAIMLVVGKNLTLYAYLVENSSIQKIRHLSTRFQKRYTFQS